MVGGEKGFRRRLATEEGGGGGPWLSPATPAICVMNGRLDNLNRGARAAKVLVPPDSEPE